MPIYEQFYYESLNSEEGFSTIPKGPIKVERVIDSLPDHWIDPQGAFTKKKKTLVLHDPFAGAQWSKARCIVAKERIERLKKEGFELYVYQMGSLKKLYPEELLSPQDLFYSGDVDEKQIINDVVQFLGTSNDELFILNYKELNALIDGDDGDWQSCSSDNVDLQQSNLSVFSLEKMLDTKKNTIKSLNLSGCLNLQGSTLSEDLDLPKLTELILGSETREVVLDKASIGTLILASFILKSLDVSGIPNPITCYLPLQEKSQELQLEELRAINFAGTREWLLDTVKKSIYLKKLYLSMGNIQKALDANELLDVLSSRHLEELFIGKKIRFNPQSLKKLENKLAQAKKLKKLGLRHCDQLSSTILNALNFDMLEELHLANIDCNSLLHVQNLAKAKVLKQLSLNNCNFNSNRAVDLIDSSHLTYLELSQTDITMASLEKMLQRTRNLEALKVTYWSCKSKENVFFQLLKLTSLKTLELRLVPFGLTCLEKMLKHATKLETLHLENCLYFDDEIIGALGLDSLKEFHLIDSHMSASSIAKLLKQAKNLEKLSLDTVTVTTDLIHLILCNCPKLRSISLINCKGLADEKMLTPLNAMPCLEVIDFSGSDCNTQNIISIISNTPNLEVLRLLDSSQSMNKSLAGFTLSSLRELHLSCKGNLNLVNFHTLKQIFNDSSSLTSLNFANCALGDLFETHCFKLNSLRELVLTNVFFYDIALASLIDNSPNLKTLVLRNSTLLGEVIIAPLKLRLLETLDLMKVKCNFNTLFLLLNEAQKLKRLVLKDCKYFDEFEEYLNLESLEELDVSGCTLSDQSIDKIIAHSKKKVRLIRDVIGVPSSPTIKNVTSMRPRTGVRSATVDADTKFNPDKKFNCSKVFFSNKEKKDPLVHDYRLSVFNTLTLNPNSCPINKAFELSNQPIQNKLLPFRNIHEGKNSLKPNDTYAHFKTLQPSATLEAFYGKQRIHLTGEWQSLASLSAMERITHYHLSDPQALVDLHYSERDNLYYIRSKSQAYKKSVEIDFIVEVPHKTPQQLPKDILDKIKELQQFGIGELPEFKSQPNGRGYLTALMDKKLGACRHRAVIFKYWMETHYKEIPVRIVDNDCHNFVELKFNNQWISYDLGGYPADLVIDEGFNPEEKESKTVQITMNSSVFVKKRQYFLAESAVDKVQNGKEYIQKLLALAQIGPHEQDVLQKTKMLVHVNDSATVSALSLGLEDFCKNIKRPYFYVHSPRDLICSAAYIRRQGNIGIMEKGPNGGGPLYDFLMENKGKNSVIVINYDQFKPCDVVKFNTLLDEERKVDGTEVPKDVLIIGIMNPNKPGAYAGADFYSRFDTNPPLNCTLDAEQFHKPILTSKALSAESRIIHLFGGSDWEGQLLGRWELKENHLHFIKGELIKALDDQCKNIQLNNAPFGDPRFMHFWQSTLRQGLVKARYEEKPRSISGVHFTQSQDYPWKQWDSYVLTQAHTTTIPKDALVLNPSVLSQLFFEYSCDNKQESISQIEGVFAKHKNSTLNIYVSAALSNDGWARFLQGCEHYQVKVNLIGAPGVRLPQMLQKELPLITYKTSPWGSKEEHLGDYCIESSDRDVTERQIDADYFFDVDELDPGALLKKIDARFEEKSLKFFFNEQEGALLKALAAGKKVVLTGTFRPEMLDFLNQFLLQRQQKKPVSGQVILLSNQSHLMPALTTYQHQVKSLEKQALFKEEFKYAEEDYKNYSLTQLQTISRYPQRDKTYSWQGMERLPRNHFVSEEKINLKNAKKQAEDFINERFLSIQEVLKKAPYVFLAGETGVGKSTFIKKHWVHEKPDRLYLGTDSIKAWAKNQDEGIKTLFIDEANIGKRQWSEFEGLFREMPHRGIIVGNEFIPLTPRHHVVFAGNPLSYGGGRQLPSLFQRHGNSIIFSPMPLAVIFHQVLEPLLTSFGIDCAAVAVPFLETAQFLQACNSKTVLISPRELSMMALLTVSYCKKHPESSPIEVAHYYAYSLAKNWVPEEDRAGFKKLFPTIPKLERAQKYLPKGFCINPANQEAFHVLSDFLDVRAMRQTEKPGSPLLSQGLGGVIIEGEPGLGKSELVVKSLLARGLVEGSLEKEYPTGQIFYLMPASMSLKEKTALLLKASKEGAVVVIDEINSAPMMESLLNDLLMGEIPAGEPPQKPGFMVIGTQNPPINAGRIRPSNALQRRMQQVNIIPYERKELLEIIEKKGLLDPILTEMVDEYLIAKNTPGETWCFRDLVNRAELVIKAKQAMGKFGEHLFPKTALLAPQRLFSTTSVLNYNSISALEIDSVMALASPNSI